MSIHKFISSAAVGMFMLCSALPARAGIPVIDVANLAQAIQEVIAWGQQASQMIDQYNKLQQQYSQLQTMTGKLDGMRSLGTIFNDPTIVSTLPTDMRNSTQLLLNPAGNVTSAANLAHILASFGVNTTGNPVSASAAADALGRAQQILASAQIRNAQLQQLATRVDTTIDAKDSMDMVNRNVLESANINNQMMQTMASLEAARQAAELKRLADNQAYFDRVKAAGALPAHNYTY